MKSIAERALRSVFKKSGVHRAHAHRFRHTLATELLGQGASFEDVADTRVRWEAIQIVGIDARRDSHEILQQTRAFRIKG